MGEPLRRLCACFSLFLGGTGDTLVQYAACLSVFLCEEEPVAQFDSDYSGGEGASIYFFLQVCRLSLPSLPRVRLEKDRMWDTTNSWVQEAMKVGGGMLVDESCAGENRVCGFGLAGPVLGTVMTR